MHVASTSLRGCGSLLLRARVLLPTTAAVPSGEYEGIVAVAALRSSYHKYCCRCCCCLPLSTAAAAAASGGGCVEMLPLGLPLPAEAGSRGALADTAPLSAEQGYE